MYTYTLLSKIVSFMLTAQAAVLKVNSSKELLSECLSVLTLWGTTVFLSTKVQYHMSFGWLRMSTLCLFHYQGGQTVSSCTFIKTSNHFVHPMPPTIRLCVAVQPLVKQEHPVSTPQLSQGSTTVFVYHLFRRAWHAVSEEAD